MHLLIKECHQTKLFFKFSAFNFFFSILTNCFLFSSTFKVSLSLLFKDFSLLTLYSHLLLSPISILMHPESFSFHVIFFNWQKNINLKISFIKTLHSNYNLLSFNLLGISLQWFHENMFWFQLVCFQKFMLKLTNDIEITQ